MAHYTVPSRRTHLNTADWISIYRIIAIPFLVIALILDMDILFGILLGLSLISDILDGYIARKFNAITERGARLDSIGDAFTFFMAILGIIVLRNEFLQAHWIIITGTVILYLAQIISSLVLFEHPTSYHTYLAKISAFLQGGFILTLFFIGTFNWLLYLTIAITVLEIAEEFILVFLVGGEVVNVKGLFWVLRERNRTQRAKDHVTA